MSSDVDWLTGPDGRKGESWNFLHGCDRVSAGCDLCYAAVNWAPRLKGAGVSGYQADGNPRTSWPGFAVTLEPHKITEPLGWKDPRRIFVNSMGDAWHATVVHQHRDRLVQAFAVTVLTPRHTYLWLTKRAGPMLSFLLDECRCGAGHPNGHHLRLEMAWAVSSRNPNRLTGVPDDAEDTVLNADWPMAHIQIGVSAEDQATALIRLPALMSLARRTLAGTLWCSFEPLLGAIDLDRVRPRPHTSSSFLQGDLDLGPAAANHVDWLDWAVIGGESGRLTPRQPGNPGPGVAGVSGTKVREEPPGRAAQLMEQAWAEGLMEQLAEAGVPTYFKQLGSQWARQLGVRGKGNHPTDWPKPYPRQFPNLSTPAPQVTAQVSEVPERAPAQVTDLGAGRVTAQDTAVLS